MIAIVVVIVVVVVVAAVVEVVEEVTFLVQRDLSIYKIQGQTGTRKRIAINTHYQSQKRRRTETNLRSYGVASPLSATG